MNYWRKIFPSPSLHRVVVQSTVGRQALSPPRSGDLWCMRGSAVLMGAVRACYGVVVAVASGTPVSGKQPGFSLLNAKSRPLPSATLLGGPALSVTRERFLPLRGGWPMLHPWPVSSGSSRGLVQAVESKGSSCHLPALS